MKKPEYYLSIGEKDFINCCDYDDALNAIEQAQKEAYNEAIKAAANAAEVKEITVCQFTDFCGTTEIKDYIVDKDSILKLKMK
ncbi:MAG TPA: hypothetical protein VN192_02820 [Flavobacterium sp.]|nr:hypothetical protein [Flavobacterium sp.]